MLEIAILVLMIPKIVCMLARIYDIDLWERKNTLKLKIKTDSFVYQVDYLSIRPTIFQLTKHVSSYLSIRPTIFQRTNLKHVSIKLSEH